MKQSYWTKRNNMKRFMILGLHEQARIVSTELYKNYYVKSFGGSGQPTFKVFFGVHLDDGLVSFQIEMDKG